MIRVVRGMEDRGPLVGHTDAVRRAGIKLVAETRLLDVAGIDEIPERHTGAQEMRVVHHFGPGKRVELLLIIARPARPAMEGAADIGAVAERTDHAAIEDDQVAGPDHPARRFLLPGIGPLAGR